MAHEKLVNSSGNTVCLYNESKGIAWKTVQGSIHLMRMYNAWALDSWAFDKLIELGITEFRIKDTETNIVYITSMKNWQNHKGEFDWGYNPQTYLPLNKWSIEDPKQPRLL